MKFRKSFARNVFSGATNEEPDPFEQMRSERRKLFAKLAAAKQVEVVGIVGQEPLTSQFQYETDWTMDFELAVWRIHGDALQKQVLRVVKAISEQELPAYQNAIKTDDTVRLRGRVADYPWGKFRAHMLLEKVLGADHSDIEMNQALKDLKKEIAYHDAAFGKLIFDRSLEIYENRMIWAAQPVTLSIFAANDTQAKQILRTAYTLWENQEKWNTRIIDFAVEKLLPLKNDFWRGDDEKKVTPKFFKNRMTLKSIAVSEHGEFDFEFADGNLFLGHSIRVSGNLKDGPKNADI
jgi:hypothetical protein